MAMECVPGAFVIRLQFENAFQPQHPFPFGTLFINVTGSYLIGLLMPLLTGRLNVSPLWRLLLVTGFLGGYTTFSAFEWETLQAVRSSERWFAFLNVAGSVLLGYLAVWLGVVSADFVQK